MKFDYATRTVKLILMPAIDSESLTNDKCPIKYESNFYGDIYGPVHTGSGNIYIKRKFKKRS
jgi:hypothetical protein